MATPNDKLPPYLKILSTMLQPEDPATKALQAELTFIANKISVEDWGSIFTEADPTPQIMAMGLARSFAASGTIGMTVGPAETGHQVNVPLEECRVPGCGRLRTLKPTGG